MSSKYSNLFFLGYRRKNGRVGVRNHVVILPVDDISNAACEAVATNIKGTMALPHAYGRLQFGADLELQFRTMIGTGANPNVGAAIVIGIESGWTRRIVEGIAATGKPVAGFSIEMNGDLKTIMDASRAAKEFVHRLAVSASGGAVCDFGFPPVRRERHHDRPWLCPTVGSMYDKLLPTGIFGCFRETSEITAVGRHLPSCERLMPTSVDAGMEVESLSE